MVEGQVLRFRWKNKKAKKCRKKFYLFLGKCLDKGDTLDVFKDDDVFRVLKKIIILGACRTQGAAVYI